MPLTRFSFMLPVLAIILLSVPAAADDNGLLSPITAAEKSAAGAVLIIDVRTPPEWAWTGVAQRAARVNWYQSRSGFLKQVLDIVKGDKTRAIATICATGVRSSRARQFLIANGFTNVHDIGEGMMGSRAGPGWLARNLPRQK